MEKCLAPNIEGGFLVGTIPAHYAIGICKRGIVTYHYPKGENDMSLTISFIYNNAIYSIADRRTTIFDECGHIINQKDDYTKIVPSSTGRFLVSLVGINELGRDKVALSKIMNEIDNGEWMQNNPNAELKDIAQHITKIFGKLLNESYYDWVDKTNNTQTLFSSTIMVLGYEQGIPRIYSVEIVPDQDIPQIEELNANNSDIVKDFCIAGNMEARIPVFVNFCNKVFENEEDVIFTLKQYILLGSERSNFVSPIYDFYKIEYDGEEVITKIE